jgi:diguanylate cyclase (GGDEF)-like protein/PAS domain S-box-containing protein
MAVVGLRGEESGRILEANEGLAEVIGLPRDELLGTFSLSEFAHPDDQEMLVGQMRRLTAGEIPVLRMEIRIARPDGETRWVELTTSMLRDQDGEPAYRLSQLIDVDERKRNEQALRHMADHDPLSWLFNHRRFMTEVSNELASQAMRGSRGAVLLMDLDKFKQVNDTAGHALGDEVIKTVGLALVRRLRSGDVAARLGGDEFAVMLRRVDAEQAILVAHDLRAVVTEALSELPSEEARAVTLSIGVAMIDRDAPVLPADLLAVADAAMYTAKAAGGDAVELATPSVPVPVRS